MIQVIDRFHTILEYVAREPNQARTMSELARHLGVSVPACSNIVKTMVHLGYLESVGPRKGYTLGPMPYALSRRVPYRQDLTDKATPIVEQLVDDIREFVVMVTDCIGKRIELVRVEPDSMVQIRPPTIDKADLFRFTTGSVLVAYKPEDERRQYWERHGQNESTLFGDGNYETFCRNCSKIRNDGFLVSEPELLAGDVDLNSSHTMAFPVFENGKITAALGSRVPHFRFTGERRELVLSKLQQAAQQISDLA